MLDLYYKVYFSLSSEKPRTSLIFYSDFRHTKSMRTLWSGWASVCGRDLEAVADRRTRAQHLRACTAPAASLSPRSDFISFENIPRKDAVCLLQAAAFSHVDRCIPRKVLLGTLCVVFFLICSFLHKYIWWGTDQKFLQNMKSISAITVGWKTQKEWANTVPSLCCWPCGWSRAWGLMENLCGEITAEQFEVMMLASTVLIVHVDNLSGQGDLLCMR